MKPPPRKLQRKPKPSKTTPNALWVRTVEVNGMLLIQIRPSRSKEKKDAK